MSAQPVQKNVLGFPLQPCSMKPLTGFYRDGCCHTGEDDLGQHTVCVQVTADFLEFSRAAGNNLSTPVRAANFPGLKPGDRWCLCAARWKEAYDAGKAPKLVLASTHESMLELVPIEILKAFALDLQ
jgi:hypothetical protein